jgi:hypothetical protein
MIDSSNAKRWPYKRYSKMMTVNDDDYQRIRQIGSYLSGWQDRPVERVDKGTTQGHGLLRPCGCIGVGVCLEIIRAR